MPLYRKQFTAQWVFIRMVGAAVSILERNKEFERAVKMLKALLAQDLCPHSRGRWWERHAWTIQNGGVFLNKCF